MDVHGKAAIVTGGGTDVGRATCLGLAERGCSVLVNYSRSVEDAERTAADARALGVKAIPLRADVSDDAAVRAMTRAALEEFGRLDVLVNNAATTSVISHAALEQVRDEDWDRIFGVNVKGAFQCVRAAVPALKAAGSAEVVNVTSVAGLAATGTSIPYCASKAALNNMTIALARVLAPEIRVNAVAPGAIRGRWLKSAWGESYDAIMEGLTQSLPLRAVSTPQDVAEAILSLITGSDLVTGQILVCDGGMMIR